MARLESILHPVETAGEWAINFNYSTSLLAYREMQYSMVQQFITIHGATKTDQPGLFPAGDVNRLLCADNFCYDTIYNIVMQDMAELYKVKGMGVARLRRIFDTINDLAGFDVVHTIHELKCIEYEKEIAEDKARIEEFNVYYNSIDDINAM